MSAFRSMSKGLQQGVVEEITARCVDKFRCFGGGRGSDWNPIAEALKDKPPQFAAGVDVAEVVRFVLENF